jgi:xanthine/uracil permease
MSELAITILVAAIGTSLGLLLGLTRQRRNLFTILTIAFVIGCGFGMASLLASGWDRITYLLVAGGIALGMACAAVAYAIIRLIARARARHKGKE